MIASQAEGQRSVREGQNEKARKAEKCVREIYRERKWNLLSDERWHIENWEGERWSRGKDERQGRVEVTEPPLSIRGRAEVCMWTVKWSCSTRLCFHSILQLKSNRAPLIMINIRALQKKGYVTIWLLWSPNEN